MLCGFDDFLTQLGNLLIGQCPLLGLVDKAISQALLASRDRIALVDIEQAHFFEQFSTGLCDDCLDIGSGHIGGNDKRNILINWWRCRQTDDTMMFIDTGAYTTGVLTAVDVTNDEVIMVGNVNNDSNPAAETK